MRLDLTFLTSLLLTSVAADTVPQQQQRHVVRVEGQPQDAPPVEDSTFDLWKRRGGGGGGGRGGGGGGGGSRGGSSGGGSRGGSSGGGSRGGSGGSSNGRGTNTQSSSTAGGYSRGGTGPQPGYLGGTVYGGGSKVPFTSGSRSPGGIRARGPLAGGALAFWPGLWLGGAYMYGPYGYHHNYRNTTSDEDEEREIICGCAEDSVCMCDEIDDEDFWDDLIGDGDYDKLNKTLVDVSEVNGTTTILVNGTLPKGTTVHSDDEDDYAEYLTNASNKVLQTLGLWPAVGAVLGAVLLA